jgi:hypothetical protein
MHSLRLESSDWPGAGARITGTLAAAGINLRGLSAAALGDRYVTYFAFDSDAEAKKARRVLNNLLASADPMEQGLEL